MPTSGTPPRRTVIRLLFVGLGTALAGCSGDGSDGGSSSVPDEYRTATSIGGQERDPDSLSSQGALQYQDEPNNGNACESCSYYITDKNGDGMGACTLVEGEISPDGWCSSYAEHSG